MIDCSQKRLFESPRAGGFDPVLDCRFLESRFLDSRSRLVSGWRKLTVKAVS